MSLCKHARKAPPGIPPDLYSVLGIDPYAVSGFLMNSGDLWAVCNECQHQRVYLKVYFKLFEAAARHESVAARYGFDNFDRSLYGALRAQRVGSACVGTDSVFTPC